MFYNYLMTRIKQFIQNILMTFFYKENIDESQSGSVKSIISLSFIYLQDYDTIIILLGSKASLATLCAAF